MPACPRDNQYSSPPPGFTDDDATLKRVQLIDLLGKVIEKYQREPEFIEQQPKQTDLLVAIAQLSLLSTPILPNDQRDCLNNIVNIGQDLLTDGNQVNNEEITLTGNSSSIPNDYKNAASTILPPSTPIHDVDGDFSLDDLANEYLQNEPSPASLPDKPTSLSESSESDLTLDDLGKLCLSSSPATNILSKLMFSSLINEPIVAKPQLESILFTQHLPSHSAADDTDGIWKEESSPFGQMFCAKTSDTQTIVTKRISTCLFDHSLYERLRRLIALLPKQCIRNSVQQLSVRPNVSQQRGQHSNNGNRHPSNRPSFQQNSSQMYQNQGFLPGQNTRQFNGSNYPNQQGNAAGHFVDRRSQQQQQNRYPPPPMVYAPYPNEFQQQQQYRHPPPPMARAPYPNEFQQQQHRHPPPPMVYPPYPNEQQQRGSPNTNAHGGGPQRQQQQKQKAQPYNQHPQQRGAKKGSGGNKFPNENSGAPGSGPSLNPK